MPERYNIAARRLRQAPARTSSRWSTSTSTGNVREVQLGRAAGALANRFANVLRAPRRRAAATAWRCCCRRRPRRRRRSSAPGSCGAILLSMSVLYGDDGHPPPPDATRRPRCWSPTRPTRTASTRRWSSTCWCSTTSCSRRRRRRVRDAWTRSADDPAQLYYTSGTTGLAKGIVHAHRYLLAHEEFVYCHDVQDGERFHGMGEWAWAAGIAPLLGPWRLRRGAVRLPARGRLRPAQAARLPLPPRGRRTSSRRRRRCAR